MTDNTINNDMTMGGAAATLLASRYRVVRQLGQIKSEALLSLKLIHKETRK